MRDRWVARKVSDWIIAKVLKKKPREEKVARKEKDEGNE
jgi:hypothetical protein